MDLIDDKFVPLSEVRKLRYDLINKRIAISSRAAADAIETLPVIDAVPVVRCGDCEYYERFCTPATDKWFCADGKRKGGDE